MIERTGGSRKLGSIVLIAGLLVLGAGAARALERGDCYRARIPDPILLPDGSLHPAGELRICTIQRLSPVEWLHVTSVDGDAIGAFRGRDRRIEREREPRQPVFVFRREPEGSFRLLGFTTPDLAGATLHSIVPMATFVAESTVRSKPQHDQEPDPVILVAARR